MIKKICAGLTVAMLISSAAATAADKDDKDNAPSEVTAETIEYDMNTKKVAAAGNVFIKRGTTDKSGKEVPSELNADAVEYDMEAGVMAAAGNVLLKYGATRATGLHALYNVKTKAASLVGNVIVVRDDMRITCNMLASNGQGYMAAEGNVIATQTVAPDAKYPNGDTRTFTSEHIDYFPDDKKHFIIPKGGVAKSEVEGTFTADQMEGWIDEEHYIGRGNAHMISPARNMEAGGDQVDYSGKEQGKAVLSGNAWAYQDNNRIRGNRLTVYMADDGQLKAEPAPAPQSEMPSVMETVNEAFANAAQDKAATEDKPAVEKKSADETAVIDPADEATDNEH